MADGDTPSEARDDADATTKAHGIAGGAALARYSLIISRRGGVDVLPLTGDKVEIGRGAEVDVVINDATVSRRHAVLRLDTMSVADLGSANGTTVNGQPVAKGETVPVTIGQVIEVGDVTLLLQPARDLGAPPSLPGGGATQPVPTIPPPAPGRAFDPVIEDPTMKRVYAMLDVIAPSPLSVLVLGETGVGKEVFAEAVHMRSARAAGPFVKINCAALPDSILESELFGYEKGAFTGALKRKTGLFEAAHGGTLFLDEIGDVPATTQAKLLRALESGEILRVGGTTPTPIDVRFVSATNRDLRQRCEEGLFRADLYFRLNGISVTLPPLHKRPADLEALARRFIQSVAARMGKVAPSMSPELLGELLAYPWPGNVRELRNVIERAVVLCQGTQLGVEQLSLADPAAFGERVAAVKETRGAGKLRERVHAFERDQIADALAKAEGRQPEAAKLLGISRRTLSYKLDLYGLGPRRK